MTNIICGISSIVSSDFSKDKIVFNLIKKGEYKIINKLLATFSHYEKHKNFESYSTLYNIKNIITKILSICDENDTLVFLDCTLII